MTSAPDGWDDAAVRASGGHVMQSAAWAAIREAQGWRAEFLRPDGAHALLLWRPLPGGLAFGYCPRGPIAAPTGFRTALEAIAAHARRIAGALVVKVDPERTVEEAGGALRAAGYRRGPDIQPVVATLRLDLARREDELLAGCDKDTRWSVRQAAKRGVEVHRGTTEDDLHAFYGLYALTGRRAGFITRTWPYYRLVWQSLVAARHATLWLARAEGQLAAGAMTWHCGERDLYMYGASNDIGRRTYASYALQWRCIMEARGRGARTYDFGGIPSDPADPNDPMHGPYLFKKGFGGTMTRYVGAHDTIARALRYRAFLVAEPLYTRALQLAGRRGRGEPA